MNFWKELPKPFFVLAPMEDVTDAAFRALIASHASPAVPRVFYTEFTSADGLLRADEAGRRKLLKKLAFTDAERPIVAQLFTSVPEHMDAGARLCRELGFDGFDINMGCPDRAVERQGCGSALIRTPELARELIRAAKRGAGDMPVSVKTRLGYNQDELETWLPALLAEEPAVITLHARTRKELSDVPARWERVARAVEIRDALGSKSLIVGNGDVRDIADARTKAAAAGCDGVMLGRAVFGNPWLFAERAEPPSREEKLRALIAHIAFFQRTLSGFQNDAVMKRHFKAYIGGWDGAKELRHELMEAATLADATMLLQSQLS
jgi:tRNA-dihydrouridine synthase